MSGTARTARPPRIVNGSAKAARRAAGELVGGAGQRLKVNDGVDDSIFMLLHEVAKATPSGTSHETGAPSPR